MKLLVLAHAGPERELLDAALADGEGDQYEFVGEWEDFMSRLVLDRPAVVILAHSTLTQSGAAGIKAADMTLRALNVAAVIALSEANKEERFPLEMETEFEHFVTEPYGPVEIKRALCVALELPTGSWPLATSDAAAEAAAAEEAKPAPASSNDQPGQSAPVQAPEPANAAADTAPAPEATMPDPPPAEPTPEHAVDPAPPATPNRNEAPTPLAGVPVAPTAASFFSSVVDEDELAKASLRATADFDTVPGDSGDFDAPAVSAVLTAFFDGATNPEDAVDGTTPEAAALGPPAEPKLAEPQAEPEQEPRPVAAQPADSEPVPVAARLQPAATADATSEVGEEAAPEPVSPEADTTPISRPRSASVGDKTRETIVVGRSWSISVERRVPEPRRSASTSTSDLRVTLSLPDPNNGDLAAVHLPRVLYALAIARATGELRIKTASLERKLTFLHGEPGTVFKVPTAADESNFLSTFQWTSGTYEFKGADVPEGQFYTFGEPLELIARGIRRHFGLNETATALGAYLKKYPVVTDQLSRFARVLGMEDFGDVARGLDGSETLERMMVSAGMETESVLRHIFFAWLTGVAIFVDEPTEGPVKVAFEVPKVFVSSANSSSIRTTPSDVGESRSGNRSGSYNAPPEQSGAHTADDSNDEEQRATFERLQAKWNTVSTVGNYEAFGLKRGCGEETVNKTFYELVREYHPDRFARSHNAQIRALAEKLFVHIRKVHGELMASETGAPPPPSSAAQAESASSKVRTGVASGALRRRQRSKEHLATSGASSRSYARTGTDPNRRVSDAMERVRSRRSEEDFASSGESRASSATMTNMRRLKPDQLFRNAKAATEQGNFSKALDLLELAKARGITGDLADAYYHFLRYTQDKVDSEDTMELLNERIQKLEDEDPEDYSMALTLAGHACRLEELSSDALKYYKRASRAWSANESASRWLRHLKKRGDTSSKKGPFSSTFLNKLFTSGKSK